MGSLLNLHVLGPPELKGALCESSRQGSTPEQLMWMLLPGCHPRKIANNMKKTTVIQMWVYRTMIYSKAWVLAGIGLDQFKCFFYIFSNTCNTMKVKELIQSTKLLEWVIEWQLPTSKTSPNVRHMPLACLVEGIEHEPSKLNASGAILGIVIAPNWLEDVNRFFRFQASPRGLANHWSGAIFQQQKKMLELWSPHLAQHIEANRSSLRWDGKIWKVWWIKSSSWHP